MAYKFDDKVEEGEKRNRIRKYRQSILKFAEGVTKTSLIFLLESARNRSRDVKKPQSLSSCMPGCRGRLFPEDDRSCTRKEFDY